MQSHTGVFSIAAHSQQTSPLSSGYAPRGRLAFIDLQCFTCHRVTGDPTLPRTDRSADGPLLHGLGDEPSEAVAWKIVSRTRLDPDSILEVPMAGSAAAAMTERQLVDLVAYLRDPAAGADRQQRTPDR